MLTKDDIGALRHCDSLSVSSSRNKGEQTITLFAKCRAIKAPKGFGGDLTADVPMASHEIPVDSDFVPKTTFTEEITTKEKLSNVRLVARLAKAGDVLALRTEDNSPNGDGEEFENNVTITELVADLWREDGRAKKMVQLLSGVTLKYSVEVAK
jgi:hypothetical protein